MNLRESGVITMSIGVSIFLLGFVLFLDKALMISGNLLIFVGIGLLVKSKIFSVFDPNKIQGTCILILGISFLFYNLTMLGFILELIGLFLLLKDNIPTFRTIIKGLLFGRVLKKLK